MKPQPADTPFALHESFVERRGGWILSLCLHVILFFSLILAGPAMMMPVKSEPEPIRVTLADPEPAAALVEAPAIQPAVATQATMGETEAMTDEAGAGEQTGNAASQVAANEAESADAQIAEAGGQLVEDLDAGTLTKLHRQAAQMRQANAVQGKQGSSAVAGMISVARAGLNAKVHLNGVKDLFTSRGAAEGVVREIDIGGVPQGEAHAALERYGIKILFARISGNSGAPAFLNRAKTDEGQFVNREGGGMARTFTYGTVAVGRMVQLEEDAIRAKGLDPNKSRVKRVVFGVVPTPQGYDLGVKKIDVEPVKLDEKK